MPDSPDHSSHLIAYMGIKALKASHPQVRKLKRQQKGHTAHGNKIWRSSFVLMDYLSGQDIPMNSKVLDIGCGWGLASIYLATQHKAAVTALDIDASVEPFLKLQAEVNHCSINFQERSFESLTDTELAEYHTLMGTDICFWDEMTTPLFDLVSRAIQAGCQNILIADPGRPPFWDLVDRCMTTYANAEVVTRRIYEPWKTGKFILTIEQA